MGWGLNQYGLVKIPVRKACNGYYVRWYYNGWHYWFFQPGTYSTVTEGEKYRTIGTRKIVMGTGQVTEAQATAIRTIMFTREVSLLTISGWMNIRIEPGTLNVKYGKLQWTEIELIAVIGSKEITYTSGFSPVNIIPEVVPSVAWCEVIIGTQIWMCSNYGSNYPGSKVYNNDETNRAVYGGLYTWNQVMSPGFCPAGWHIPTTTEWAILIASIGDMTNGGGILKEVGFTHWTIPNTGAVDTYGFAMVGSGYYLTSFLGIYEISNLWTADEFDSAVAFFAQVAYNSAAIGVNSVSKSAFFGVRLIKDNPFAPAPKSDWFLPSKLELAEIYSILHLSGLGGFSLDTTGYWSSTENNVLSAFTCFGQRFDTGAVLTSSKNSTRFVRPIRYYTSTNVYALRGTGEAGGLIFKKTDLGGGVYEYYECWIADISISYVWTNPPQDNIAIGATAQGTAIGTGQGNTLAIIGQAGHSGSAAELCNSFAT